MPEWPSAVRAVGIFPVACPVAKLDASMIAAPLLTCTVASASPWKTMVGGTELLAPSGGSRGALNEGRTIEQKRAFYKAIATGLNERLQMRLGDVFINLVEVRKENWSFGNGEAQYAPPPD
ncbi:tautomerase family protein [Variovorax sp. J2P1-59]|uniref:tautomerase family protein n=1 Tax=Variovorax flavidus TaxID=3053501 RepID=UPI002576C102|nr:tautomerase family protein [Variovorax sp. J2P1-59]MDM0078885.1 tautomerase family protein [Variovorax sp. J2P1-59]